MGRTSKRKASKGLRQEIAHPDHGWALRHSLRDVDRLEMRISHGCTEADIGDVIVSSISGSDQAFTICEGSTIHGVWGHGLWMSANHKGPLGYIWLLSDDYLFQRYAREMTRVARRHIFPQLDELYDIYGNLLMSSNHVHRRWLEGANFSPISKIVKGGEDFLMYIRGKRCAPSPQP